MPEEERRISPAVAIVGAGLVLGVGAALVYALTVRAAPPGAEFEVSDLVISPEVVSVGQSVIISVLVINIGTETGSKTIICEVDGAIMAEQIVTLAPGESEVVTFEVTPEVAKTYSVSVDGLYGSFRATEVGVAAYSVVLNVSNPTPAIDEIIAWYADITNIGNAPGAPTANFYRDGVLISSPTIPTLDPNEVWRTYASSFSLGAPGIYTLRVEVDAAYDELTIEVIEVVPELANIYGVITFRKTGAPLEGVKASVDGRITYSNYNGAYRIENLTPRTYTMTLEKEGYEPLSDVVTIVAGDNEINAEMTLVPALIASLHGYVTDAETGGAIVGAEITVVELTDFMEANVYKTTSGPNGFYSLENMAFENRPIIVDISVLAAGYTMIKLEDVPLAEGANVKNFEMTVPPPKKANFRGKVVDAPTDAPLEGVLVTMDRLTTYTGTDGWFEFTDVTAKRYTIELSKEGYEPKSFEYTLREGDNEYPAPINMTRIEVYAARLYGYITDNETGGPVFGADITVYQDYDTKTADYHVYTDEQGYYEITDMIPEVRADMVIYAGGYKTYTRTGIPIHEGDNERNIILTWAGGPRDVPRFIDYSLPPQIVGGSMFPANMRVWLPYQNYLFRFGLQLKGEATAAGPGARLTIPWNMLPASLWDRCNEYTQGKYTRFDAEGECLLEAIVEAIYRPWHAREDEPLPPGIYEVSADIHRQVVEVNPQGGLTLFGSEAPGDYRERKVVGTVEII